VTGSPFQVAGPATEKASNKRASNKRTSSIICSVRDFIFSASAYESDGQSSPSTSHLPTDSECTGSVGYSPQLCWLKRTTQFSCNLIQDVTDFYGRLCHSIISHRYLVRLNQASCSRWPTFRLSCWMQEFIYEAAEISADQHWFATEYQLCVVADDLVIT